MLADCCSERDTLRKTTAEPGGLGPVELCLQHESSSSGRIRSKRCILNSSMFRRAANLLLSVLLVATLLWGGCVACPQFFQSPITKKSCCTPTGQCKNTKSNSSQQKSCQFQQVELQQKLQTAVPTVSVSLPAWDLFDVSASPRWSRATEVRLGDLPESPHAKQAILSTFLI